MLRQVGVRTLQLVGHARFVRKREVAVRTAQASFHFLFLARAAAHLPSVIAVRLAGLAAGLRLVARDIGLVRRNARLGARR